MNEQSIALLRAGQAPAAGASSVVAAFEGRSGPLLRLCLKNAALSLLTLFIYRFWAKTNLRRYFWGHTCICGDFLEYTGTGKELYKGFLVAFVLLVLLSAVAGVVTPLAEAAGLPEVAAPINLVFGFGLASLWFAAIHRAWRYRLSRTRFRGVGMHLDGSTRHFLVTAWRYTLLVVVTLGVAMPYQKIALTREIVGNARLGTSRFALPASGRDLLGAWVRHLLIVVISVAIVAAAATQDARLAMGLGIVAVVVVIVSYVAYRVKALRYVVDRVKFGDARFASGVRVDKVARVILTYLASLLIVPILLFLPVVVAGSVSLANLASGEMDMTTPGGLAAVGFIVVPAFILIMPTLKTLLLDLELARQFFGTLTVSHPEEFDRAVQDTDASEPRQGEGLADVFGIDGI